MHTPEFMLKKAAMVYGIFILISISSAWSAEYHVAKTGSDSNTGTEEEPWLTIQKAADSMVGGDTVIVGDGIYNEEVDTKVNGEGEYITFKAASKWGATVKQWDMLNDYNVIDGFKCTGFDDATSYWIGIVRLTQEANFCKIQNCFFILSDIHNYGIRFHPGNRETFDSASNVTATGNIFENFKSVPIFELRGANNIIENNEILNCEDIDSFRVFGHDHTIRNNYIHDVIDGPSGNHLDIIQTFGNNGESSFNILFENNYIKNYEGQICMLTQDGVADIRDWTFRNNVFSNIVQKAVVYLPGTKWYNNTFINIWPGSGHTLNFISQIDDNNRGMPHNTIVENNIFIGCGKHDTGWYFFDEGTTGMQADFNFMADAKSTGYASKSNFMEPNGINGGDPRFYSIENGDYRIQSDSPARDNGKTIADFNTDRISNIRQDAWDIGAYEFTLSPINAPTNLRLIEEAN